MESIVLDIDQIQLHSIDLRADGLQSDKDAKTCWTCLKLGNNLNLAGLVLQKDKHGLGAIWGNASFRILDGLISKRNVSQNGPRLSDCLEWAVYRSYQRHGMWEKLIDFLEGKGEAPEFPALAPYDEAGKTALKIPVEYVEIFEMSTGKEDVLTCNIRIGHHIVFWREQIKIGSDNIARLESAQILDENLLAAVNQLANRNDARAAIDHVLRTGMFDINNEFTDIAPGCSIETAPPIQYV